MQGHRGSLRRGRRLLALLALAAGCREAAQGLSGGPGGAAAATALVDALRARYGTVSREPDLEKVRPKLEGSVLVPSRVFDDASVWTVTEGDWRALWLEGRGRAGAYALGRRAAPALPRASGEYRARIALRRQPSGAFEWETFDELALGPVRPAEVSAAFRSLLRAAEATPPGDARGRVVSAMPRAARALGRLYDLEALSLSTGAEGTRQVEVVLRQRPDRLKAELPKFAAFLARRSRSARLAVVALVRDGRPLWSAEVEEGRSRLRLRTRGGQLVPLDGPPAHEPGPLLVTIDYSFAAGPFRVGVRGLKAEVELSPGGEPLAFTARFARQPDWRLPFVVEPFMRASLRYPFEGEGSQVSLAMREEPGRGSVLVSDSRLPVRESWIVRWFGGFSAKAMAELRLAEAEAGRYALECLTAVREDLAALTGAAASS